MNTIKLFVAGALFLLLHSNGFSAPPSQPQNVQQAWLGTESLLLWDDTPEATSYNVYRSDSTNTTWMLVGSSAVPRFRDPTWQFLPSFYTVTAVNADGESAGSDLSTVSYADQYLVVHSQPQWWDGTLTPTNAIIQWYTDDPNGSQGIVDWGLNSTNFNFFAINTNYLGSQRFDLTNLTPLTIYYYRLTSINSNRSGVVYIGSFGTPDTNHPPVAEDYTSYWPSFTNGIWLPLRGHDSNNPPASLTFRIVSQPTNGTLSDIQPSGTWNQAYVIYTPGSGARGYDRFRFVVNNGTWDSAPGTVTVTNWVNTPPAVTNGFVTTAEDTPIALQLPMFDAEGDPITFNIAPWSAWRGTVSGEPPNLIFTPETNFNGTAFLSYTVTDGYQAASGWFQIDVTPVNDRPELRTNFMSSLITGEDWPVQISLYVFDVEGAWPYEYIVVTPPAHGTLGTPMWDNITYTPETNFYGADSFTLVAREPDGTTSEPLTYWLTVLPWNDPPVGIDQDVTMLEDTSLVITPTGTDIDSDPALFTFEVTWGHWPMHGWMEGTGTNFIYHPAADFFGTDEFQFNVIDDSGYRSWERPGTIRITVLPVGEAPVVYDSYANAHQDAFVNAYFSLRDVDSETLACEAVTPPANGTVEVSGTNFLYRPNAGYQGSDFFTYRAFDGEFYSAVANVYVWVSGPNNPPQATPQTISAVQNTELTEWLLVFDPDSDFITGLLVEPPQHGTLVFGRYIWGSGLPVTYTPTNDFVGTDSFTYQASDGVTNTSNTLVTINVALPNEAPIAFSTNLMTQRDVPLNFALLVTDADGDTLTYIVGSPTNGTLSGTAPNLTYTPNTGFMGTDSFTFRANDGTVNGNTATVIITTTRPNVAPTAASQSATAAEDTSLAITLSGSDGDGDALTFRILSGPSYGTLTGTAPNLSYRPATNYNGSDSFAFTANDGIVDANTATVSLTITPVNDAPILLNPTTIRTLPEEWVTSWNPAATDPDGDPVTFRLVTPPSHGTLDTTNWLYRAPKDYNGGDYFSWVVNDGQVDSALGTFSISITPVNDAPVASNQTVTVDTDISTVITPLVSDVDNTSLTLTVITQPQHGTVTLNGMIFSYQPVAGYSGSDSFTYRASDGSLNSSNATISINIVPVNNPPVRVSPDRSFTISEDWYREFDVQASDADGDALTYRIVSQPTNGILTQLTSNTWRYRPNWNWFGSDSLTWVANDGQVDSTIGTVWFNVTAENDRPLTGYDSLTNAEDTAFAVTLWASDVEGSPLTYTILTLPTNGVLSGTGSNRIYTPNPNFVGGDSLTYKVNDGQLDSSFPGTILFTVTNVNDAPVATNQSVTTDEDVFLHINLGLTDPESNAITRIIVTPPEHGYLTFTTFSVVYWPTSNFSGSDSFTFRGNDGITDGNIGTVSITVRPVNDFPTALPQTVFAMEDQPIQITLASQDVEGGPIAYQINGWPTNGGTLSGIDVYGRLPGTNATLTYTPAANFSGTDAFWFRAIDDYIHSAGAWVTVVVQSVNDGPVANNQNRTTAEDTSLSVTLTGSDIDGDALTFAIVNNPTNGTLSGSAPNFVYTPNTNFNGSDAFVFRASDGAASSAPATVSITVTPQNDPPVANAQNITLDEDSSRNIELTGTDFDGDVLSFAIVSGPAHGTVSGTPPNVVYTPAANYNGTDSFTFRASDSTTNSATVSVSIIVTAVNDTPVANNGSRTLAEDTSAALTLTASDVEGDPLTFSIVALPTHGTLSGTAPNLVYTPAANYYGSDSFTFRANDGQTNGNTATVLITVTPVNDAPVANAGSTTTPEDTPVTITMSGTDLDGDALTYYIVRNPTKGYLNIQGGPSRLYTPYGNTNGIDSFDFAVQDASGARATNTFVITVTPVNDPPVALFNGMNISTPEDTARQVLLSAYDVDNDVLTFSIVTPPAHGAVSIGGVYATYTPAPNYFGGDSFSWKANDGQADSSIATINVTIASVNDAPTATNLTVITAEDTTATVTPRGADIDGDTITFVLVAAPLHGGITSNGTDFIYTPFGNYNGADTFTYAATDGQMTSAVATVSITVTPVNDAPVANTQSRSVVEDGNVAITLTGSDVEGSALTYIIVTDPAHGTLSGSAPNVTYTPAANYFGPDSFTFKANDGAADSAPAQVSLTVTPVNDAPVANAQSVNTAEDTATPIVLTATDADGDALSYTMLTSPTHGSLSGTAPNLTYTPAANYFGSDSFTFRVNDGTVNSGTATVSITVLSVNDAPVANAQSVTVTYNTAKAITLTGSDLEGSALTYAIVSGPTNGALSGTAPNVTYTPTVGSAGADFFTFRVNDGSSNSAAATVSLTTLNPTGIPSAPSGLNITVPTATGTLILNWNCSATNEDGFKIERSLSSGNGWSEIATTGINIHTFTNTGLTSGTRYYYRVRSYNRLGNSAYSNTKDARPR